MKKSLILFAFLGIVSMAFGQSLSKDFMHKHAPPNLNTHKIATVATPTSGTIVLLTPSIAFSGSAITFGSDGSQIKGEVVTGMTYNLVIGSATDNGQGGVDVTPYIAPGVMFLTGGIMSSTGAKGTFAIGGNIQFYKYLNIGALYDPINKQSQIVLGAIVNVFALSKGPGAIILSYK